MNFETRQTWRNVAGNQAIEPLRIYRASRVDDVVTIVREAERLGVTAKAVGSHHSWSDVACTHGFVIETHGLATVRSVVEADLLRPDAITEIQSRDKHLIETEAGIRLRELNLDLERRGLALSNMGESDDQTLAGAISTSSYGSGIEFGPLGDQVRSLDVIASGGTHYRIEPASGLTSPREYRAKYPGRTLVQNDDWFQSAVVSLGCLGVIVSMILEVEPRYWLTERRMLSSWATVKAALRSGDQLRKHRHLELLLNPHPNGDGDHTCLVTTRDRATASTIVSHGKVERDPLQEIMRSVSVGARLLRWLLGIQPKITPAVIERGITSMVGADFTDLSHRAFNAVAANRSRAVSSAIGIAIDDRNRHVEAVERLLAVAKRHREIGGVYHPGPIGVRFVKSSSAYLSMAYGHDTMMVEPILLTDAEGGMGLLAAYEEALYPLGGRPHWGQLNALVGTTALGNLYPELDRWLAVHRILNSTGVFDNPFSKRLGIAMTNVRSAVGGVS